MTVGSQSTGLNEGGSNSTLVVRDQRPEARCMDASMKEGRIRPSLLNRQGQRSGRHRASMKEGRIRPSLRVITAPISAGGLCLNEGGSNSTLVDLFGAGIGAPSVASMKEGRIRPSLELSGGLVGYGFHASMKEGRIRPSLIWRWPELAAGLGASMKEGRIRPSLSTWSR